MVTARFALKEEDSETSSTTKDRKIEPSHLSFDLALSQYITTAASITKMKDNQLEDHFNKQKNKPRVFTSAFGDTEDYHSQINELLSELKEKQIKFNPDTIRELYNHPNIILPIIDILDIIETHKISWISNSTIRLDSFIDRDSIGSTIFQIILHYPSSLSWEQQMDDWDVISEDVGVVLPSLESRRRILIAVEPE